ncbi:MAG: ATP-dependent Clp protease ATP-binding subunit, partial [Candidatus Hydrogenedentes bacterium]|nr:ATP-dependent Clp protease ATP-binding subunit [Candidatus Hydrogenedentota bacterium]
ARKTKNNVILVGEAGVGKTKVVEGLALNTVKGGTMDELFSGYRVLELKISALTAGTAYRGAFEEKVMALLDELKKSPKVILFIDEIHLIMGAGATEGSSVDFANLLKPALARGEIRCVGATTLQEYRKFVERDPAIERRFQLVRVEELSEEATAEVLAKLKPSLEKHHGVKIGSKAVAAALTLTQRYMPNRKLPDKAIDVLDQACARYRLKSIAARTNPKLLEGTLMPTAVDKVTPHDIRKVISQLTAIPIEEMTAEERRNLTDLERRLKQQLIGQDEAVAKVVAAVIKSRAGLSDPNRPDAVMLFMGPTGVGKTQLCKLLADALFGSPNHLITFDMSEYIEEHSVSRLLGAPPGYQGSDEEGRLSSAVRGAPFSVLLFDEIEKAHPRIFDIFLPIFDEGRLKDNRGREISFKNCIIILTTNIGAELMTRSGGERSQRELMDALRQHFRPELINRIDEIVPFHQLLFEDVYSILRISINDLRNRLKDKRLGVRMYREAYEMLAEEGYKPEFGARELRRVVDRRLVTPISELVMAGKFDAGDMIDVRVENGKLTFSKGEPHKKKESVDQA